MKSHIFACMKVGDNTLAALKTFFQKELLPLYDERECENLFRLAAVKYLDLSYSRPLPLNSRVSESDLLLFFSLVKRLKKHEPVQYILGEAWFFDMSFKVSPAVLVPRPETEELVDWVINEYKNVQPEKIVDLCSGSGCIPIALKKYFPSAAVIGYEISSRAIAIARENAEKLGQKVTFTEADVLQLSPADMGKADVITANPPYIGEEEKGQLAKNVIDYEPHIALFVPGDNVFLFYLKIAELARECLVRNGKVFVEIHYKYGKEVKTIFEQAGLKEVTLRNDLSNNPRMISATAP